MRLDAFIVAINLSLVEEGKEVVNIVRIETQATRWYEEGAPNLSGNAKLLYKPIPQAATNGCNIQLMFPADIKSMDLLAQGESNLQTDG